MRRYHFLLICIYGTIFTWSGVCIVKANANLSCTIHTECGWNNYCANQTCLCNDGFNPHRNGRDCIETTCLVSDCVNCAVNTCSRCLHFIDKATRQCFDSCQGKAEILYTGDLLGSVCTSKDDDDEGMLDVIIGVVAGVSAGLILVLVIALCIFFYTRKRGHVNLRKRHSRSNPLETGSLKQIPVYDNSGFEPDVMNATRDQFRTEIENLKPHETILTSILTQSRIRLRCMNTGDPRIPTYKGVIHQLCRVMVMLNKKDPVSSIPADGLSLLGWANQLLQDYMESTVPVGGADDDDVDGVFTVGEPDDGQYHGRPLCGIPGIYATPLKQYALHYADASNADSSGYYSSVPVPYLQDGPKLATFCRSAYVGNSLPPAAFRPPVTSNSTPVKMPMIESNSIKMEIISKYNKLCTVSDIPVNMEINNQDNTQHYFVYDDSDNMHHMPRVKNDMVVGTSIDPPRDLSEIFLPPAELAEMTESHMCDLDDLEPPTKSSSPVLLRAIQGGVKLLPVTNPITATINKMRAARSSAPPDVVRMSNHTGQTDSVLTHDIIANTKPRPASMDINQLSKTTFNIKQPIPLSLSTFAGGIPRSLSSTTDSDYSDDSYWPNPDGLPFDPSEATEPIEI